MTLQQLKYVLAICQTGSISKAAQSLYIAQPNLSAAIKKLESEVQTIIFTRTSHGMVLTEAGKQFVRHATQVIESYEAMEALYVSKRSPVAMLAVYTARSSEICYQMTRYINRLNKTGVPFRIQLKETTNTDVVEKVVSGDADVGIVRSNSEDAGYFRQLIKSHDLTEVSLPPTQYQVLMSASHPLAEVETLTPYMLSPYIEVIHGDYEMPMYPYSDYNYHRIESVSKGKKVIFISDRGTLMDILSNVEGSYIWTTTTNQRLKDTFGLVERRCYSQPVEGLDAIIYDRTRHYTKEMKAFIELLTSHSQTEDH